MSIQNEIRLQPSYSRWLTEEVFNLIDLVRSDEAIYNPRHKYYFCRPYVENFWREVDLRLRKNSGASLAKWTNLRISFRREYANFQEEKVAPCWTYFDKMLFLHPYLRNKKQSEPKGVDPHLQEALAQINSLNYKSQQNTSESPVNEYIMDQYLSYCEDDPHPSPGIDDIIDEDTNGSNLNSIQNEIKIESSVENDEKNISQESDEFKDIIIEISDEPQPRDSVNSQVSPNVEPDTRSLLKRPRTEVVGSQITPSNSNNVSLVRPLGIASFSNETNMTHNSIQNTFGGSSNRITSGPGSPARRNDLCECKTDSDAMFLMSLLPDIRKLNGRDRGRIKIAFQNIVQEFLYPD